MTQYFLTFFFRTNLEVHTIPVTHELVKKLITGHES